MLYDLEHNKDEVLIVAGGGGGTAYHSSSYGWGGNAGGIKGNDGTPYQNNDGYYGLGGTQTAGGISTKGANASYNRSKADDGSFGRGGNSSKTLSTNVGIAGGGTGGGAGWYGGAGGTTHGGSGGGSSYIGNSKLVSKTINGVTYTKHMVGNNVETSDN